MRFGVAAGARVCIEAGAGIAGVGHFSEFTAHAKSKVGMGGNVGVVDGGNVDVGVGVTVGGAFQQNSAPPLHSSGSVGVGEIVGVEVSLALKQASAKIQLSGGGGVFVFVGVFGSNTLNGENGVTPAALPGSSGSHSTPYTGAAKT